MSSWARASRTASPAADHHCDRLLLGPCRPGIGGLDRRDPNGNRSTVSVDQGRPQALGPDVQAQEQWRPCRVVVMGDDLFDQSLSFKASFRLSSRKVTGPSFTSSTFIIARKTPVATSDPTPPSRSAQAR